MTSSQAFLRIKLALNKLDSNTYQNITPTQVQESVNIGALRVVRKRLPVKESTTLKVDDIQVLLKTVRVSGSNKATYFYSHKLPNDYMAYSRNKAICTKDSCIAVEFKSDLIEDGNVDEYLTSWDKAPSFEFEQTFHSLNGNKIKQYHNGDFEVKELELTYYKTPQYIEFPGAYLPYSSLLGSDMRWEFNESICDVIIEEAVGIIAGNTDNVNRYNVSKQTIQETP